MTRKPQLHFGVSLGESGVHPGAWRLPSNGTNPVPYLPHYVQLAKTAERGLFDMVFMADGVTLGRRDEMHHEQPWREFEPLTLLAALAGVTQRVGLVSTASTTFSEPYNLARYFSSLDHLSGGRAGWNAVTSLGGAENFGLDEIPPHVERYARAEEFLEVVSRLWNSWEDDAKIIDRAAGVYADPSKIHDIDYVGRFFKVKGPLNISRTPQGRPVIIQAGSSGYGKALGAKYAEVIFTAQSTTEEAVRFTREMRELVAAGGRDASQLRVMPGISPIIGRTRAEAQEKFEALTNGVPREVVMRMVGNALHAEIDDLDLDDVIPEDRLPDVETIEGHQSRYEIYRAWAVDDKRSIRQLSQQVMGSQGHWLVVDSAEKVADLMIERLEAGAADGFNIVPPALPQTLDDFVDLVIPIVQERGYFRTEYEGTTLREHLGLEIPAVTHAAQPA